MWKQSEISPCKTHHRIKEIPMYTHRFSSVQKFHEPGLAPVLDESGAYHIYSNGNPAYPYRFKKTFGFYCNRAAVIDETGAYHIHPSGEPSYSQRYAWSGNFQCNLSTVRTIDGNYHHIALDGTKLYSKDYSYAGDFRDGIAVVCLGPNNYTHIDIHGKELHNVFFHDLDVFHKGFARAKDQRGWFHIDLTGNSIYDQRYSQVEPFYNGAALVEAFDGSKMTIDPSGEILAIITPPSVNFLHSLSADMVSFWKSETIFVAAELGVLNQLPIEKKELAKKISLSNEKIERLMRALWELDLVFPKDERWELTSKGKLFISKGSSWMISAAKMWKEVHRRCWSNLHKNLSQIEERHFPTFKEVEGDLSKLKTYLEALDGYSDAELNTIMLNLEGCRSLAGTGRSSLPILKKAAQHFPSIQIQFFGPKVFFPNNLSSIEVDNYLDEWPIVADAMILTKFMHYWPDKEVLKILDHAKKAAKKRLFIIEFTLWDSNPGGSLLDLNMLVESGGKERTYDQIFSLIENIGLKVHSTQKVGWGSTMFEVNIDDK